MEPSVVEPRTETSSPELEASSSSSSREATPLPSEESTFTVFTSLRYDPALINCAKNTQASKCQSPFYLLTHHRDRMLQAAEHFEYPESATALLKDLEAFKERLQAAVDASGIEGPLKLRPSVCRNGICTIEVTSTTAVSLDQLFPTSFPTPSSSGWSVILDTEATPPTDYTRYKTSERVCYDEARERAGIRGWAEKKEVLVYNEDGNLMEGSFTNVFVETEMGWVTPEDSCGGQRGTSRRWALENGLATEGVIRKSQVPAGSRVIISNGVRGFWFGKVCTV